MNESIKNIKIVIREKIHLFTFLLASIFIFGIFSFLTLVTTADYSIKIFIIMNGMFYTILTFLSFIVISLLFGLYITLLIYKIKKIRKSGFKTNIFGIAGLSFGVFGAGCPMCGSLIFGFFGAPLALFFMPFKGLELRFLSIILMFISVFIISKNLNNKC